MLSIDTKNVFLIGGAAVAVLAGAYVIWGPSERRRRKKGNRRGNTITWMHILLQIEILMTC